MKLVEIKEAAKVAYVTGSMISHWVKGGQLIKYPMPGYSRRYRVDLDEVVRVSKIDRFREKRDDNLITRIEAGKIAYVGDRVISYYVKMGYVKAHYVFGNNKHYLVDRNEILAQKDLMLDRVRHVTRLEELSRQAKAMPRDENGHWAKRTVA